MCSVAEHGTLYQLRNVIRRNNVVKKPIDQFDACDEFFCLVVEALILNAFFEMKSLDDILCKKYAPQSSDSSIKYDLQSR